MTDSLQRLTAALADRYAVERELGSGGMATVYLAEDLKHHRKVAVKVLRPELAAVLGAERFVQEITTTANLQHPHILPLFDSGEADGFLYFVMPYIEGETLRDKLNRETQLSIDEAVRIATEVADALDSAHQEGVIHRDIKPENILLHKGRPMVADFGIALAVSAAAGGRMTETGLSLGTPHYMSPEQATAEKDITHRSDIYSLGSVLYEMLTGEPPHIGGSAQAIIMKILTDDADRVAKHRHQVPTNVDAAVQQALAKIPADRFGSAADFAAALANPSFTHQTIPTIPPHHLRTTRWNVLSLGLGVVAAVLAGVALWGWMRAVEPASDPFRLRVSIALPDSAPATLVGEATFGLGHTALTVSPDGSRLVYVAARGSATQLFVRSIDRYDTAPIPGTEGAYEPFFAPDGEWVGFFRGSQLMKVSLRGGAPVVVTEAVNTFGASWGDDDRIYFAPREGATVSWVSSAGGAAEVLTAAPRDLCCLAWPSKVPGLPLLLVNDLRSSQVIAVNIETGTQRRLSVVGGNPRYVAPGYLLYSQQDAVMAVPFDIDDLEVTGQTEPVLSGVRSEWGGAGQYTFSHSGLLIYVPGGVGDHARLGWFDESSGFNPLPFERQRYRALDVSPDGRQLAIEILDAEAHVWLYDLERGTSRRLTTEGNNHVPIWTSRGDAVTWLSKRDGRFVIVRRAISGGEPEILLESASGVWPSSWSPDDRVLAGFGPDTSKSEDPNHDIWIFPVDGDGHLEPLVATPASEWGPSFSPDGRFIAYTSDESGAYEIWVEPYPQTGDRWTVSSGGGNEQPVWDRSGTRLYYRSGMKWMVAEVSRRDGFSWDTPRQLVNGPYLNTLGFSYDVDPNGRLLLLSDAGDRIMTELRVVTDWFSDLRESRRSQ